MDKNLLHLLTMLQLLILNASPTKKRMLMSLTMMTTITHRKMIWKITPDRIMDDKGTEAGTETSLRGLGPELRDWELLLRFQLHTSSLS